MTRDELIRSAQQVIEALPEYSIAEDILDTAITRTMGTSFITSLPLEEVDETRRAVYRTLKQAFDVTLVDDHATREDLDNLRHAVKLLDQARIGYLNKDLDADTWMNRGISYIEQVLESSGK